MFKSRQDFVDTLYTFQCCLPANLVEIIEKEKIGKSCHEDKTNLKKAFVYLSTLKNQIQYFIDVTTDATENDYEMINSCLTKAEMEKLLRQLKYYCNECCVDIQLD